MNAKPQWRQKKSIGRLVILDLNLDFLLGVSRSYLQTRDGQQGTTLWPTFTAG